MCTHTHTHTHTHTQKLTKILNPQHINTSTPLFFFFSLIPQGSGDAVEYSSQVFFLDIYHFLKMVTFDVSPLGLKMLENVVQHSELKQIRK